MSVVIKNKSRIILLSLRKNGALERHITWVWEKMKLWLFCEPVLSWQHLGIKPTIAEFSVLIWQAGWLPPSPTPCFHPPRPPSLSLLCLVNFMPCLHGLLCCLGTGLEWPPLARRQVPQKQKPGSSAWGGASGELQRRRHSCDVEAAASEWERRVKCGGLRLMGEQFLSLLFVFASKPWISLYSPPLPQLLSLPLCTSCRMPAFFVHNTILIFLFSAGRKREVHFF